MAADPPFWEWEDPNEDDIARFDREYGAAIQLLIQFVARYTDEDNELKSDYKVQPTKSLKNLTKTDADGVKAKTEFVGRWYTEVVLKRKRVYLFVETCMKLANDQDDESRRKDQKAYKTYRTSLSEVDYFLPLKADAVLEMMYREPLSVILQIAYYVISVTRYGDFAGIIKQETNADGEQNAFYYKNLLTKQFKIRPTPAVYPDNLHTAPQVAGKDIVGLRKLIGSGNYDRRKKETPAKGLDPAVPIDLGLGAPSRRSTSQIADPNAAGAAYRAGQAPPPSGAAIASVTQGKGSRSVSAARSRPPHNLAGSYSNTSEFSGGEDNDNGEGAANDSISVAVFRASSETWKGSYLFEDDPALHGVAFPPRDSVLRTPDIRFTTVQPIDWDTLLVANPPLIVSRSPSRKRSLSPSSVEEPASKRARAETSAEVLATVKALHSMRKEDSVRKRQNKGR